MEIETCHVAREYPGLCCMMKLDDPSDRCGERATVAVLVIDDGLLSEHLRCDHHAAWEAERASVLAAKPYRPSAGFEVDVAYLDHLDDELRGLTETGGDHG